MMKRKNRSSWARTAIIYHIYPLSFKDSNSDGKGDLKGILEKLDYLNDGTEKSLGVNAIWLSPVYCSPMADFGYDVSDYYEIDPVFGDLEIFEELVREVHGRGMKILMDFIPNHTSAQHPWFLESRVSRDNPKRNWYIWQNPKPNGAPPNNWLSCFGRSAWTYDEKTQQYYLHSFFPEQPDLNWRNLQVQKEMRKVLQFWLARGVDGFRVDAISHIMIDEQLRDDPPNPNYVPGAINPYESLLHIYSKERPELQEVLNTLCEVLDQKEDRFMVSEAYVDIPGLMALHQACKNGLHAPMNLNFIEMPWNAQVYRRFIDDFEKSLSPDDIPVHVLGNHDRSRIATRLGQQKARLAALLIFTLQGIPLVYYGEEIGMEDEEIPEEKIQDPLDKRIPGFKLGRDPARTPMQWSAHKYAGFSDALPWLPIGRNYKTHNVEDERKDSSSMFNLYRNLIHYRKKSPILLYGSYESIDPGNNEIVAFLRKFDREQILVALNFSQEEQPLSLHFSQARVIYSTCFDREPGEMVTLGKFRLKPYEGVMYRYYRRI